MVALAKSFASAITIGTGGSGGREGPIAQIGAGFGSFLATQLKLSARDRPITRAAGMGAGVGAIFRRPRGRLLRRRIAITAQLSQAGAFSGRGGRHPAFLHVDLLNRHRRSSNEAIMQIGVVFPLPKIAISATERHVIFG